MFKITKAQIMHVLAVPIAALGAFVATVASKIPGIPHLPGGWYGGIFTTAFVGILGVAIHYLHGWQLWERDVAPYVDITDGGTAQAPKK